MIFKKNKKKQKKPSLLDKDSDHCKSQLLQNVLLYTIVQNESSGKRKMLGTKYSEIFKFNAGLLLTIILSIDFNLLF